MIRNSEISKLVEQAFPGGYVQTLEDPMRDALDLRVRVFDPRHDQPYHVARKIDRFLLETRDDPRGLLMDELRKMHHQFEIVGITFDSAGPKFDGKTASQIEHDKRVPTTAEFNEALMRDSAWEDEMKRRHPNVMQDLRREYPGTFVTAEPEPEPEPEQPDAWGTW